MVLLTQSRAHRQGVAKAPKTPELNPCRPKEGPSMVTGCCNHPPGLCGLTSSSPQNPGDTQTKLRVQCRAAALVDHRIRIARGETQHIYAGNQIFDKLVLWGTLRDKQRHVPKKSLRKSLIPGSTDATSPATIAELQISSSPKPDGPPQRKKKLELSLLPICLNVML